MEEQAVATEAEYARILSIQIAEDMYQQLLDIARARTQRPLRPNVSAVVREALEEYLARRDTTLK